MTGLLTALVLLLMMGGSSFEPAAPQPVTPPPKPKPPGPMPGPTKPQSTTTTTPTTPVTPQVVPTAKPATTKKPTVIPVSWPTAAPKGLPAFPSGWEADVPPPAAVTARAWALLPTLWKSGKPGATAVEQTAGRWITYQAAVPSKGKKGVVAWRIKGNPPAGSLPSGVTM
jgi:hypothetical protein